MNINHKIASWCLLSIAIWGGFSYLVYTETEARRAGIQAIMSIPLTFKCEN
jgi:hypothetical protein